MLSMHLKSQVMHQKGGPRSVFFLTVHGLNAYVTLGTWLPGMQVGYLFLCRPRLKPAPHRLQHNLHMVGLELGVMFFAGPQRLI